MSVLNETKPELPKFSWDIFTKGNASSLAGNRHMLSKFEAGLHQGPLLRNTYKLVLDANFIWNEIGYHLSVRSRPSILTELRSSGLCEFHAPAWLLEELESSVLPKLAKHHRISTQELRAIFDEFIRPQIQFHIGYLPPKNVVYEDSKDVPYVELAEDIEALGVISQDSDIEVLLMRKIDRTEVLKFIELARIENGVVQVKCMGYLGVNASCGTVSEISKSTSSLIKKTPKEVLGAAALVGVLGLVWFGGTQRGRKQAKVAAKAIMPLLKTGACFVGEGISWTKLSESKASEMRKTLEKAKG